MQLSHQLIDSSVSLPEPSDTQSLTFLAVSDNWPAQLPTDLQDEATHILPNMFLASSENGFTLGQPGSEGAGYQWETPWTCTVPGGSATVAINVISR